MKRIALIAIGTLFSFFATAQSSYSEAIQQGDQALRNGQYKTAINKYFAAEAFDPSKKDIVKARVNKAFDRIEALRREAEDAKKQALFEKENAQNSEQKAQKALQQVKQEQEKTQAALAETEKAKNEAQEALQKANKLINAFIINTFCNSTAKCIHNIWSAWYRLTCRILTNFFNIR